MSYLTTAASLVKVGGYLNEVIENKCSEMTYNEFIGKGKAMVVDIHGNMLFMMDTKGDFITDASDLLPELLLSEGLLNCYEDMNKRKIVTINTDSLLSVEVFKGKIEPSKPTKYAEVLTINKKKFYLLNENGKLVDNERDYLKTINDFRSRNFLCCKSSLKLNSVGYVPKDKVVSIEFIKET